MQPSKFAQTQWFALDLDTLHDLTDILKCNSQLEAPRLTSTPPEKPDAFNPSGCGKGLQLET